MDSLQFTMNDAFCREHLLLTGWLTDFTNRYSDLETVDELQSFIGTGEQWSAEYVATFAAGSVKFIPSDLYDSPVVQSCEVTNEEFLAMLDRFRLVLLEHDLHAKAKAENADSEFAEKPRDTRWARFAQRRIKR
jgi:hypothetical protein